jgi:hypothetical protein
MVSGPRAPVKNEKTTVENGTIQYVNGSHLENWNQSWSADLGSLNTILCIDFADFAASNPLQYSFIKSGFF